MENFKELFACLVDIRALGSNVKRLGLVENRMSNKDTELTTKCSWHPGSRPPANTWLCGLSGSRTPSRRAFGRRGLLDINNFGRGLVRDKASLLLCNTNSFDLQ